MKQLLALLLLVAPAHAVVIDLYGAEVTGKEFRLGDVAVISGVEAETRERLNALVLGASPVPGRSRVLSHESIKMRLIQDGFLPKNIVVRGEREPLVHRPGQVISVEAVSQVALDGLSAIIAPGVSLNVMRVSAIPMIPKGDVTFEIEEPARLDGTFPVTVVMTAGGETFKTNVMMKAARMGSVLVATRRLDRGEIIPANALVTQMRDLNEIRDYAPAAVGRIVTRPIPEGSVISSTMIEREQLIRKGDRIVVRINLAGIELSAPAEANEAGSLGEVIKVRNIESRKIIAGRITGPGEVTVID